jgi:ribosomal protein L16 Arg81 hydroxylase
MNNKAIESFKDLIFPIEIDQFKKENFDEKFLHVQRNDENYYNSIFSIKELDVLLSNARPKGGSLRVVKNQQPLNPTVYENPDGSLNLNQLYVAYADGHTIVINEIQRFWIPIKTLVENIRNTTGHHAVANLYLTPPNEKALSPHYDTHDVFAVQISGEKHWLFYDDTDYKSPLLHSFQPIFQREQLKGQKEITIKAGDLFYIPRGLPHEAYTTSQPSMHLTIGLHSTQWIDFIYKSLLNMGQKHIELRKALPFDYLNKPIDEIIDEDTKNKFLKIFVEAFTNDNLMNTNFILSEELRNTSNSKPDGHFESLNKLEKIDLDTKLKIRDGFIAKVTNHVTGARIFFQGNTIKGPSQLADTFLFIANQPNEFLTRDIPKLDDGNKIKIVKKLVRGGLLRVID